MAEPAAGTHCVSTTHWYRHHQQILKQLHQRQKVSSSCGIAYDHYSFHKPVPTAAKPRVATIATNTTPVAAAATAASVAQKTPLAAGAAHC